MKHTYYLSGAQIIAEVFGNKMYLYLYDAAGAPFGMQYRDSSMAQGAFYTY